MFSPDVRFFLLGPLEIAVNGRTAHLTGRQRGLLAALLLDAGRVVSVERLAEHLWGDDLPPSAPARLRALIAELRRALGPRGRDVILTRSPGYLLRAEAGAVDAEEFAASVESARRATEDGRHPDAADLYDRALALWRGDPFADLAGPAAQVERYRLEELRCEAAEGHGAALLETGRSRAAIPGLTRLLAEQPLRERPHALLMRALRDDGRLPDALEVYQDFRTRLVHDLGVEPSGELQLLHQRMLGGRPAAETARPVPVPRQLPPASSRFVGRAEALRRMDADRVTLVVGPAGVGKTALAIHWAHAASGRFPDGQLFLDMRGFDQREPMSLSEALQLLLQGCGVAAQDIPVELDAQIALYRSCLAGRRMLVILDDVAEPGQVRALLPGDPGCRAVVTSRYRLGGLAALDGVERLTLDVLDREETRRLLSHGLGEDRLLREPDAAEELMALCGRLPLALSIAMSWIGDHEHRMIAHYVRQLADRGRLVRLRVEGHESVAVQAALDLSHRALPPAERRMFRLLGVAQGGHLSAAAAAALAGTGRERAEDLLGAVARIHLIKETGPQRFAAHDLVLEYAAQRSLEEDSAAEREAAVRRLLDYYLRTVIGAIAVAGFEVPELAYDQARPEVTPTTFDTAPDALDWLDTEWDNLVAAVSHAAAQGPRPYAWLLVEAMKDVLHHRRTRGDWLRLAELALAAAEKEGDLRGQAAMCHSIGLARWRMTDLTSAMDHYERALALSRRAAWPQGEAMALQGSGVVFKQLGEPHRAVPRYRRAVEIHHALGSRHGEARGLNNLASAHLMLAQLDRAEECLRAGLPLTGESGDRHLQTLTLVNLALVRQKQARLPEALEALDEALALAQAAGLRYAEAVTYETFGWTHHDAGRYEQAIDAFGRGLAIAEEVENKRCQIASLTGMAGAELELGRADAALARLDAALELSQSTGTDLDQVLLSRAEFHYRQGRFAQARHEVDRPLTFNPLDLPRLHGLLAAVHLAEGDREQCVQACEQALELARRSGQRLEYARVLMTLGHALKGEGREHWEQAHELFTAIGAPERARTAALLAP
ncbi:tetratricopeptide repeat protein [Nonomuraea glycinis]|uniref:SARP family transcriptional regulator n=1 Tax=Nonomuraea glycinis TaxID=2047744 RepID=A0A918AF40_9ACTN|nr:AfsR/SARP family transcriptional regulator [Nonomuraea glycinis]MCA2183252.1 tetratricopeptide repeat protein [Nonomuraea glycinis]GGP18251.1 SARP family transcriptional regulator [Nonomuraea glycinis]